MRNPFNLESNMNALKKFKLHKLLSLLTIAVGFLLLIYMIVVEDEPGAIPLLLITGGTAWYLIMRARSRSH